MFFKWLKSWFFISFRPEKDTFEHFFWKVANHVINYRFLEYSTEGIRKHGLLLAMIDHLRSLRPQKTTRPQRGPKTIFFIFCLADSNSQNFFSHFILIIALLETITCGNRNYRESKHGFFKPESIFAIFREISWNFLIGAGYLRPEISFFKNFFLYH